MPFLRVTKASPCPICGKPDWCMIADDGTAAICPRTESNRSMGEAGYLHKLDEPISGKAIKRAATLPDRPDMDWQLIQDTLAANHTLESLQQAEIDLGVPAKALQDMGIGWSHNSEADTFPMSDGRSNVIGVRVRARAGKKWCITGSRNGLFIPAGIKDAGPLCIVEGPTDAAAVWNTGMDVIGRPSNTGGQDMILAYVLRRKFSMRGRDVLILQDRDQPGSVAEAGTERGSVKLATAIHHLVRSVHIFKPHTGKDARQWHQTGYLTYSTLLNVAMNTTAFRPPVN